MYVLRILSKKGKIRKKVNSQVCAPLSLRSNKLVINVLGQVLVTGIYQVINCQVFVLGLDVRKAVRAQI